MIASPINKVDLFNLPIIRMIPSICWRGILRFLVHWTSSALRRSNSIFRQKIICDFFLKESGIFPDLWPHNGLDFIFLLYRFRFSHIFCLAWILWHGKRQLYGSDSYLQKCSRCRSPKSVFLNSFVCQSITISDQCLSGWKGTILIKMSTAVQKYNFRVNRWQELKLISKRSSHSGIESLYPKQQWRVCAWSERQRGEDRKVQNRAKAGYPLSVLGCCLIDHTPFMLVLLLQDVFTASIERMQ